MDRIKVFKTKRKKTEVTYKDKHIALSWNQREEDSGLKCESWQWGLSYSSSSVSLYFSKPFSSYPQGRTIEVSLSRVVMRCRWDLRVALGTKSDLRWMLSKNQMITWPLGKLSDEGSCGNGFSCLSVHCPKIHLCTCAGEDTALNSKCFLGAVVSPVVRLQGGRISRVVSNTLQVQGAILALCPGGQVFSHVFVSP